MLRTNEELHYFKIARLKNVDKRQNNDRNSKNITLNKVYCAPKSFNKPMETVTLNQLLPAKKDLRFKKNNLKQHWEISEVSDSQLWMQSRAFRGIIGIKIKNIREKKGISQLNLALRLGWDQGYQSRIEGGKVNICLITLAKIAIVLDSIVLFEEKIVK
jgi:DNA-binding XRE family transcriptional regulator